MLLEDRVKTLEATVAKLDMEMSEVWKPPMVQIGDQQLTVKEWIEAFDAELRALKVIWEKALTELVKKSVG